MCLIVNMWNALPRLLECIFWQAPLQFKHIIVRVASAHAWLNACLCRIYSSEDILGAPEFHLGLIPVVDWNIFCREVGEKRVIVEAVTVILNSEMCRSQLPLPSLCQRCHRDEGIQRKGASVNQKPISHVCTLNRSAAEARHIEPQQFKTEQQMSNDFNPHLIS